MVSVEGTPANVHDVTVAHKLIREDDTVVYGDSGYIGIEKREEVISDEHLSSIEYRINRWPGKLRRIDDHGGLLFASSNLYMCARAGRTLTPLVR